MKSNPIFDMIYLFFYLFLFLQNPFNVFKFCYYLHLFLLLVAESAIPVQDSNGLLAHKECGNEGCK